MRDSIITLESCFTHLMLDGGSGKVVFHGKALGSISKFRLEVVSSALVPKKSGWEAESLSEGQDFVCEIDLFPRLRASMERSHPVSVRVSALDSRDRLLQLEAELRPWRHDGLLVVPHETPLGELRRLLAVSNEPPQRLGDDENSVETTGGEFPGSWEKVPLRQIAGADTAATPLPVSQAKIHPKRDGGSGPLNQVKTPGATLAWDAAEIFPEPEVALQMPELPPSRSGNGVSPDYRPPPRHPKSKSGQKAPPSAASHELNSRHHQERTASPERRRKVVSLVPAPDTLEPDTAPPLPAGGPEFDFPARSPYLDFDVPKPRSSARKWLLRGMAAVLIGTGVVIVMEHRRAGPQARRIVQPMIEAKRRLTPAQQELPGHVSIEQRVAPLNTKIKEATALEAMKAKLAEESRMAVVNQRAREGRDKINDAITEMNAGSLSLARRLYSEAGQLLESGSPELASLDRRLTLAEAARERTRVDRVKQFITSYYEDPAEVAKYFIDQAFYKNELVMISDIDDEVRRYAKGRNTLVVSIKFIEVKPNSHGFDLKTYVVINTSKQEASTGRYHHQEIHFQDSFKLVETDGSFKISMLSQDFNNKTREWYE